MMHNGYALSQGDEPDDEIDDAVVYRPPNVPEDVWAAALKVWQCDPSDEAGYRQPPERVGQQRLSITCRAVLAEREHAALLIDELIEQKNLKGRDRMLLVVAARAVRRGRNWTIAEQVGFLNRFLDESEDASGEDV